MTSSEKRRLRRERCAAKCAARNFADEVRGKRTATGVAYGLGGHLINVPAQKARRRVLWDAAADARTDMTDETKRELNRWRSVV